MLESVKSLKDQPCCGYFLQGGVRAVAILDIGISLFAMILFASEMIRKFADWVDMKKDPNLLLLYYVRAGLWASFFAVKILIIGLSVFLFKTARRRNGRMCKLWIFLTIVINIFLLVSATSHHILFKIPTFISIFALSYMLYKAYCIHIVYTFVREIKSYGGFNACLSGLTDAEVEEFEKGNPPEVNEMKDQLLIVKKQAFNKEFEVPIEELDIDETTPLGSGAFGTVYRATYMGDLKCEGQGQQRRCVAVKTIHNTTDPAYFKTLLGELKIMTFLPPHENIVNLIGACTSQIKDKKLYIIVEFCPFGNLCDYLKARRGLFVNYVKNGILNADCGLLYRNINTSNSVTTIHLIQWTYQMSQGMQFLEEKKVIHGDLAARNLLLGYGRNIKITDFGLSKKLYQYTNYVKTQDKLLPWRWMAIESLRDMKFSSKSDVWALGICIWEIFSLAEVPFPGFSWTMDFISELAQGLRMKQPANAPDDLYEIMVKCWNVEEQERPCFAEICEFLKENYLSQEAFSLTCGPSVSLQDEVEVYIGNVGQVVRYSKGHDDLCVDVKS